MTLLKKNRKIKIRHLYKYLVETIFVFFFIRTKNIWFFQNCPSNIFHPTTQLHKNEQCSHIRILLYIHKLYFLISSEAVEMWCYYNGAFFFKINCFKYLIVLRD